MKTDANGHKEHPQSGAHPDHQGQLHAQQEHNGATAAQELNVLGLHVEQLALQDKASGRTASTEGALVLVPGGQQQQHQQQVGLCKRSPWLGSIPLQAVEAVAQPGKPQRARLAAPERHFLAGRQQEQGPQPDGHLRRVRPEDLALQLQLKARGAFSHVRRELLRARLLLQGEPPRDQSVSPKCHATPEQAARLQLAGEGHRQVQEPAEHARAAQTSGHSRQGQSKDG